MGLKIEKDTPFQFLSEIYGFDGNGIYNTFKSLNHYINNAAKTKQRNSKHFLGKKEAIMQYLSVSISTELFRQ